MAHMSQPRNRVGDAHFSDWGGANSRYDELDLIAASTARTRAMEEVGHAIARQLNGPLTALLLYMEELKQHSHRFSQGTDERDYLQKVVENALQQTERVCALVKQVSGAEAGAVIASAARSASQGRRDNGSPAGAVVPEADRKPLTKREREVLNLISEGYSNKQGALRMQISPRTFESHRAEAMRKLGARNTADLVRAALLHPID
jgi:DNA-binding CsgD family transcriptional regulator